MCSIGVYPGISGVCSIGAYHRISGICSIGVYPGISGMCSCMGGGIYKIYYIMGRRDIPRIFNIQLNYEGRVYRKYIIYI